jgi:flagellar basal-body rod protein FlgC
METTMSFWNTLRIGATGLNAQRLRLDVIANNVANAETTRTDEGTPYRRTEVVFRPEGVAPNLPPFLAARAAGSLADKGRLGGVKVASIIEDETEGPRVYDPSHPDADEEGFVSYPNVNIAVEMTNLLSATRSYEANLTVIDAAKRMALQALNIGR